MARLPVDGEYNWGGVLNEYLLTSHNPDGTLKATAIPPGAPSAKPVPAASYANGLPLFNVEDYGAVGDGVNDDYKAVLAAWNAMLASDTGGCLFFPRPVVYRIDAGISGRLKAGADGTYALFGLPLVAANGARPVYGIVGVGKPYAPAGDGAAFTTVSSVLFVDYGTDFTWSDTNGLPSIFGAPDQDKDGGKRSNVHFVADGMTIRQPKNPSLCCMNIEGCASASIGSVAFDVAAALEDVPEPTHPTGAALLLPAAGNKLAVTIREFLAIGYYTGLPYTEHADIGSAIVLRCKTGVSFRRGAVQFGHIATITIAQCPWGFAGYDPSASGLDLGVVGVPDKCTVKVDYCDFTDDSRGGKALWTYAPAVGAHFYDPNNCLNGLIWASRNDVDGSGHTDAMWVAGAAHFSLFGLFGFTVTGSERIDASAHAPSNQARS